MVAVDPRGGPAAQGSAVLPSARREFGIRIRRLCFRAESVAGRFRRADPPFASGRNLCEGQVGQLSPAQSLVELIFWLRPTKKAPCPGAFCFWRESYRYYFAAG